MPTSKPWYKSVTVWFNVALAFITFLNAIAPFIPFPPNFIAGIATLGNVLLRFKTDTALTVE